MAMAYNPLRSEDDAGKESDEFEIELKAFTNHTEGGEMVTLTDIDLDGERATGDAYYNSEDDGDTNLLVTPDQQGDDTEGKDGHYEDYEAVLRVVGFGLFQVLSMIAVGVAVGSDAVEILSISFVLPFLRQTDELGLVEWQTGLLSAIIFLGMLFGSYIWGGLADITGRRQTLIVSLTVNGVFGAVSSLSPNFYVLLLLRFVSGLGVGGSLPIIPMYLSELAHSRHRGPYLGVMSFFWMFGVLLCGGLAWVLLPLDISGVSIGSLQIHAWRVFLALSAVPSILGAGLFFILPESPRFLLEVNKETKALKVLKTAFWLNNLWNARNRSFPVRSISLKMGHGVSARRRHDTTDKRHHCFKNFFVNMVEVFRRVIQLLTRKLWKRTLVVMAIYFCVSFSYYGVTIWYPSYVDTLEQRQEDAAVEEVCNLTLANQTVQFEEGYQERLLCTCPLTVYDNITFVNVSIDGGWVLSGGSLMNSSILGSNLTTVLSDSSTWTHVQVTNALFTNSNFSSGSWSKVTLQNVRFENSLFCGVDISGGIELSGVEMKNCTVNGLCTNTDNDTAIFSALHSNRSCSLFVDSGQCIEPEAETDYFSEYLENFFIAASPFPTTIIAAVLVYFFRRSFLLCFFLASSALSCLLLLFFSSKVLSVFMLCIFYALVNPCWNVIVLLVAELYPTSLRSTAMGVHLLVARIGAIIGTFSFGAFGYSLPAIPIISVVSFLGFGAVLALFLPKTNRMTALT